MRFITLAGRRYGQFESFSVPDLVHAFSTRPDDVSARQDAHREVRAARRAQMLRDFGLNANRLHYCVQIHEPRIKVVNASTPFGSHENYDALITAQTHVALMNFSADCPLLLIYDPRRRIIAQAHASWRCSVARIAATVVEKMAIEFASDPADLIAGIGPSAGPCCYEVKNDVRAAAESVNLPQVDLCFPEREGRMYFDLWHTNRQQLVEAGINHSNIELAGICTMCRNDVFFSFRREGAGCGHFGLMSSLAEPVALP